MCRIVGVDDPSDFPVIDTFCTELAKAREILFGNATSESGEPVERFTGIDKLFNEALLQLQKFFFGAEQHRSRVVDGLGDYPSTKLCGGAGGGQVAPASEGFPRRCAI
ncbi:hypothetical protein FNYG_15070 [Fusarium nygamai]|uniref:Uncharacterized protein n=1 Tax=Gibberella nygamai TaxID=42673 RepID=A0A2K0UKW5_GIBNY|nr:hypothetical protein FNYG_15070 [Fusarium nygamai]